MTLTAGDVGIAEPVPVPPSHKQSKPANAEHHSPLSASRRAWPTADPWYHWSYRSSTNRTILWDLDDWQMTTALHHHSTKSDGQRTTKNWAHLLAGKGGIRYEEVGRLWGKVASEVSSSGGAELIYKSLTNMRSRCVFSSHWPCRTLLLRAQPTYILLTYYRTGDYYLVVRIRLSIISIQ